MDFLCAQDDLPDRHSKEMCVVVDFVMLLLALAGFTLCCGYVLLCERL